MRAPRLRLRSGVSRLASISESHGVAGLRRSVPTTGLIVISSSSFRLKDPGAGSGPRESRGARRARIPAPHDRAGIAVPVAIYLRGCDSGSGGQKQGVGRGDVDRHGVRAGHAGAGRPARAPACARSFSPLVVADDLVALVVIATAYAGTSTLCSLLVGVRVLALVVARALSPVGRLCIRCWAVPGWRCSNRAWTP